MYATHVSLDIGRTKIPNQNVLPRMRTKIPNQNFLPPIFQTKFSYHGENTRMQHMFLWILTEPKYQTKISYHVCEPKYQTNFSYHQHMDYGP